MGRRFTIGRSDASKADILLHGKTISAKHAELYIDEAGVLSVFDLGSSNGTIVLRKGKGIKVGDVPFVLESTDVLQLGGEKFTIPSLMAKISSAPSTPVMVPQKEESPVAAGNKMRRCLSCGSVTPLHGPCVSCGSLG
jgi:pSer/pThr/pTyr-binding forkhead associated (FHA) protein